MLPTVVKDLPANDGMPLSRNNRLKSLNRQFTEQNCAFGRMWKSKAAGAIQRSPHKFGRNSSAVRSQIKIGSPCASNDLTSGYGAGEDTKAFARFARGAAHEAGRESVEFKSRKGAGCDLCFHRRRRRRYIHAELGGPCFSNELIAMKQRKTVGRRPYVQLHIQGRRYTQPNR